MDRRNGLFTLIEITNRQRKVESRFMTNEGASCPSKEKSPCLFKLLISPSEQFRRMKKQTRIVFPLFIVTLITLLGMILSIQGMDFIENDPDLLQMSEAELALFLLITQVMSAIFGMMTPVVTVSILSAIYFGIAKIVKSPVAFRQLFAMNTFLFIIPALHTLVNSIGLVLVGEIHGDFTLFTSTNIFFGQSGLLGAIFCTIDIFTIIEYIFIWKGLRIVAEFSKRTTTIIIFVLLILNIATFLLLT